MPRPPRQLASLAVVLMLGLVGCTDGGSTDDRVQSCEPGEDVVAFNLPGAQEYEGTATVAVTGAGSGGAHVVTGDWVATDPNFSPDGQMLVVNRADGSYESAGPDATTLWLVGVHGEHPRPLTSGPYDSSPTWSPDGGTIAFVREDAAHQVSIDSVASTGGKVTTILDGQEVRSLAWSPDGERLAYLAVDADEPNLTVGVWTVRPDGAGRRRVATVPAEARSQLVWEPDGDALWLAGTGSTSGGLWRVGLETGDLRLVDQETYRADWSSDGRRLYVIRGSQEKADFTLSVANVTADGLVLHSDLGAVDVGFPYGYYGFDVGPCLPDGLAPADLDAGPDRTLEDTTWRDGAKVLRFDEVGESCGGPSCPVRLSASVGSNGLPVAIDALVTADTITATSSDVPPEMTGSCLGTTSYFLADRPTRYRIDGDQLRLSRDDCGELLLIAEPA